MLPRRARAQSTTKAQQLLVLYCQGGMRSNALFTMPGASKQISPFGVTGSKTDAQFILASPTPDDHTLAAPFTNKPNILSSWTGDIGNLYTNYNQFSVLGPVDHNPGGDPVLDMQIARNLIATGNKGGGPGLLTVIGNKSQAPLPPFAIGDPALIFGQTAPGLEAGAPIFIRDPLDVYGRINSHPAAGALASWEQTFQQTLDARQIGLTASFLGHPLADVANGRAQLAKVRQYLTSPQFQFGQSTNFTAAHQESHGFPVTNGALEQAFLPFLQYPTGGPTLNSDYSDPLGAKICLAVRALQYGSPAVAVGFGDWNFHSNEKTKIQALSVPLGRVIASLLYVLAGLPGNVQKRKLDEVLIVVVSEFGRDNTAVDTGFNAQNGSDYRGTNASRFQTLPVFGAGIKGGKVFGGLAADLTPTGNVYSSAQLWATMVNALGIDYTPYVSVPSTIDEMFA